MGCENARKAMVKIFSSSELVDEIYKLSIQKEDLLQKASEAWDAKWKEKLTQKAMNVQSSMDAAIFWWLLQKSDTDLKLKTDIISHMKKSWSYDSNTVALLEWIDKVETNETINNFLRGIWLEWDIEDVINQANKKIQSEEYLKGIFNNWEKWNPNIEVMDEIKLLLWDDNKGNLNYYLVVSNLFKPWDEVDLRKTLGKLSWDYPEIVSPKALANDIDNASSVRELLDIVTFNLWTFKKERAVLRHFKVKLDKLKVWAVEGERDIVTELWSMVNQLTSGWKLKNDTPWFISRLHWLGIVKVWQDIWNIEKMKKDFRKVVKWWPEGDPVEILWEKWDWENIWVIMSALWPQEIMRLWLWKKSKSLAPIIFEALGNLPESELWVIQSLIELDDVEWLSDIMESQKRLWQLTSVKAWNSAIQDLVDMDIDFSKKGVYFDVNKNSHKSKSSELQNRIKIEEDLYSANSINTFHPVEYSDTIEWLEKMIAEDPSISYIYISDNLAGKDKKLQALMARLAKRESWNKVRMVIWDRVHSSFKLWHHNGNLTIRARTPELRDEVFESRSIIDWDLAKIGSWDIPEGFSSISEEGNKELGQSWLILWYTNFADELKRIQEMDPDKIISDIREYFSAIWYEVPKEKINVTPEMRKDYFNRSFSRVDWDKTPENINKAGRKSLQAAERLKSHIWLKWWRNELNHYAVSYLTSKLRSYNYRLPQAWIKKFMKSYIETWTVDTALIKAINTSNPKIIEKQWEEVSVESVENILREAKWYLWVEQDAPKVDLSTQATWWEWYYVGNTNNQVLNNIRLNRIVGGSTIPEEQLTAKLNWIVDNYINKIKPLLSKNKEWQISILEKWKIDKVYEELYQAIDEYEFIDLETNIWFLYTNKERARKITWIKFNWRKVYNKIDEALLDDFADSLKQWNNKRISDAKTRLKDGKKSSSLIDNWYEVKNSWWKLTYRSLSDAILEEVDKARALWNDPGYSPRLIDEMDLSTQQSVYRNLVNSNKDELSSKGFVRFVQEKTSRKIRDSKFFDRYKLVDSTSWRLPEAVADLKTEWISYLEWMQAKKNIYDKIVEILKDPSRKHDNNIIESSKTKIMAAIENEIKSVVTIEWLSKEDITDVLSDFSSELIEDFEVYAHISWVKKDELDRIRELYKIEDGVQPDEWDDYIDDWWWTGLWSAWIVDDYSNYGDPEVKAFGDKANKVAEKFIREEALKAAELKDSFVELQQAMIRMTWRDVAVQNQRTQKIYDASRAVSNTDASTNASNYLDRMLWSVISNTLFDKWAAYDVNILRWLVYKNISNVQLEQLNEAKAITSTLMEMSDDVFAKEAENMYLYWEWWWLAFSMASYFRKLRDAMWTDGLWWGPSRSKKVNNALHDSYKSFTSIKKWSNIDADKKNMYEWLMGIKSAIDTGQVLRFLETPTLKEQAWDLWKAVSFSNDESGKLWYMRADDLLVSTTKDSLEAGRNAFNELFGSEFNTWDFMLMANSFIGIKDQSRIFWWLQRAFSTLKLSPWLPLTRKLLQIGWTYFTWARAILWYASVLWNLDRGVDGNEVTKAGKLRDALWRGQEIEAPLDLAKVVTPWIDLWKYSDELSKSKQLTNPRDFIANLNKDSRHLQEYNNLAWWKHISFVDAVMKVGRDYYTESGFKRTLDFTTMNGNNFTDFLYLGKIKDYAFLEALKSNKYNKFWSVDEFVEFVRENELEDIKPVLTSIFSTADRITWDIAGTSFSTADNIWNRFTGVGWKMFDALEWYQNFSSYLSGWGRNKSTAIGRNMLQWFELVRQARFNKKYIDDVADFVANTPEFRLMASQYATEVINATRAYRASNEDDEDGTFGFRDILFWIEAVSQSYQAIGIVPEFRPILRWIESAVDWDPSTDPMEQMKIEFYKFQWWSLKPVTFLYSAYNDAIREAQIAANSEWIPKSEAYMKWVVWRLSKYFINASKWSFKYMLDQENRWWVVRWDPSQNWLEAILGIPYENRLKEIFYEWQTIWDIAMWFGLDQNWWVDTPFYQVSRWIGEFGKLIRTGALFATNQYKDEKKPHEAISLYDQMFLTETISNILYSSATMQEDRDLWQVKMLLTESTTVMKEFENKFIKSNIFIGTPSAFLTKLGTSQTWDESKYDTEIDRIWNKLLDSFGEERLSEIASDINRLQTVLWWWKEASEDEQAWALSKISDPWDRQAMVAKAIDDKSISEKDSIIRREINSILYKQAETFKEEPEYQTLWAAMFFSELIWQRDIWSSGQELVNKMALYNAVMPVAKEAFPREYKSFLWNTIARREWEAINKEVWFKIFKGNEWFNPARQFNNAMDQHLELRAWAQDADLPRMKAALSDFMTTYVPWNSRDQMKAMHGVMYNLEAIQNTTKLTDSEKAYTSLLATKSFFQNVNISDLDFESFGEPGLKFERRAYETFYKLEDQLKTSGVESLLDELNAVIPSKSDNKNPERTKTTSSKVSVSKVTSPGAPSVSSSSWWKWKKWTKLQISKPELSAFSKKLSKSLNKKRAQYKLLDSDFTSTAVPDNKVYANGIKDAFPTSLSAKTRSASWFTKWQLATRKDIKRNLKPVKQKKLKIPLV